MATRFDAQIKNFVVGEPFDIPAAIDMSCLQIPGPVLTDGWMTVKRRSDDTDAAAIFQTHITPAYVPGAGQIVDNGAGDLVGKMVFEISAANSAKLKADIVYRYSLKVKDSFGHLETLEQGTIEGEAAITVAS